MGVWGPALFSDDVACDVRDEYRALVEDGIDDKEATRRILNTRRAALTDPDDGPVIWLALAVTQSKTGRLEPNIASRALEIISRGEGMQRWEEQGSAMAARRRAAMEKVRNQLTGPQPPRRRLRPPWRHVTSLRRGDVIAYHTRTGDYLLLRVTRIEDNRDGAAPVLVLLDFADNNIPPPSQIAAISDRSGLSNAGKPTPPWATVSFVVHVTFKGDPDYADAGFVVVCNIAPRPGDESAPAGPDSDWDRFGQYLDKQVALQPLPVGRPAGKD